MIMKKRVTISLLFLMLAMVLAGCGDISKKKEQAARELIDKMITAADGAVVSKSDCTTEFKAKLIYNEEEEWNCNVKYETHNEYDTESGRVNSETTYYSGEEPYITKFHMNEEMGVFYIYGKQDATDWIKYDAGFLKEEMSRNFVSDMNLENAEIVEFIEDYKKVNEKNVHRLRVKLKDASVRELLFEAGFKMFYWGSEYNSIDLSDVDVQIDYYVDPETSQVVELEAQLDGMENFLHGFEQLHNNFNYGGNFKESEISRGKLSYTNISYEELKVPMLSVDIKKDSLLVYQEEVTYDLKVMEAEAEVVCPKMWYTYEKSSESFRITRFDGGMSISYLLQFPFTYEDVEHEIDYLIESYKEDGSYVSDRKSSKIGDFEAHEIVRTDGTCIYAYKPVGRTMLVVWAQSKLKDEIYAELAEILDKVKLEEIEF